MWDGSTYQAFTIPSVPSQLASEPQLLRDHASLRARSPPHSLAQIVAAALLVLPVGAQVRADTCVEPPVARLTSTGQRNGQPFWAPNGEQVAFVSDRSGSWQVWIMSATGANARQITQVPGPVGWPSWAPDGSAILFYGSTPAGYRMFKVLVASRRWEPLYHEPHQDFRPLLSPDGMQLLFDRSGHDRPADHDLFVRNIRDGSLRQITQDAGYDSDARWSPDGRRIVWHSDRNSSTPNQTQIYSSSADGSDVRQLTRGPGTAGYPSWSPDGKRIAYTVEFEGNRDVWLMNADGTNRHRLTTHSGFDGDPAWSPAGDRLLISTGRFGGQELALVELARCRKRGAVRLSEGARPGATGCGPRPRLGRLDGFVSAPLRSSVGRLARKNDGMPPANRVEVVSHERESQDALPMLATNSATNARIVEPSVAP